MILNFGLLLEEDFAQELIRISRSFADFKALEYELGENSLPHVTILQFKGTMEEAPTYWERLSRLPLPAEIRLHFHGIAVDRFREWDALWARIKPHSGLREAQRLALTELGPRDYINGLGDLFEPHATLAAWPSEAQLPALPLPKDMIDRANVRGTYSLGISGPRFQYARCLFRRT